MRNETHKPNCMWLCLVRCRKFHSLHMQVNGEPSDMFTTLLLTCSLLTILFCPIVCCSHFGFPNSTQLISSMKQQFKKTILLRLKLIEPLLGHSATFCPALVLHKHDGSECSARALHANEKILEPDPVRFVNQQQNTMTSSNDTRIFLFSCNLLHTLGCNNQACDGLLAIVTCSLVRAVNG